jgi:hypothetical protein
MKSSTRPFVARQSKSSSSDNQPYIRWWNRGPEPKLVSSPKPPEAVAERPRLYASLGSGHNKCRMQLSLDDNLQRQSSLIVAETRF